MKAVRINHHKGNYDVKYEGLQSAVDALPDDVRIITDSNVIQFYGEILESKGRVVIVSPGEHSKSLENYSGLLSWLANSKASRKTTICAVGGGVVGDLAGFVAATYMRGVPFRQIPTTLLSQVDSSVGGKVGVDLPEGKNLVGAFYPPVAVSIAVETLATLPERQFSNGMAEVWKYGFIMDSDLVKLLQRERLDANHPDLESIIERCVALKASVVEADEFDDLGLRAILNYGHTVGHAIEVVTGYKSLLHGEAISVGMVVEAKIGELLGITEVGVKAEVQRFLRDQGLPIHHDSLSNEGPLLSAMYGDKKATAGSLAFSLLTDIGRSKLVEDVPKDVVLKALRES